MCLVLSIAVLGVFGRAAGFPFVVWDDNIHVYDNPHLNPVTSATLPYFWTHAYKDLYIPVTYTLWTVLASMARLGSPITLAGSTVALNAGAFHALNIGLHLVNTLLVFRILRRFVKREWAAAAGAALFALHPVQVEPVAWVSELKGVLSTSFALASMRAYIAAVDSGAWSTARGRWVYSAAMALFCLALLAKPSTVVVPLIVMAVDYGLMRRPLRSTFAMSAPWLALAAAMVLVTRHVQPVSNAMAVAAASRLIVAGDTVAFYLTKLVAPFRLGIDYGRPPHWALTHPSFGMAGLLVLLGASIVLWRIKRPALSVAGIIFIAAILPVLGLVPFQFQAYSTVADRYLYLALLGPALVLAKALDIRHNRAFAAVAGSVLIGFAALSYRQLSTWSSTDALLAQELRVNPNSFVSYTTLGRLAETSGDLDAAEVDYRNAVRLNPSSATARNNLGELLVRQWQRDGRPPGEIGLVQEASTHLETAVRLVPGYGTAHGNLGGAYFYLGRFSDAAAEYRKVLATDPDNPAALYMLGAVEDQLGDRAVARAYLQKSADAGYAPAEQALQSIPAEP